MKIKFLNNSLIILSFFMSVIKYTPKMINPNKTNITYFSFKDYLDNKRVNIQVEDNIATV